VPVRHFFLFPVTLFSPTPGSALPQTCDFWLLQRRHNASRGCVCSPRVRVAFLLFLCFPSLRAPPCPGRLSGIINAPRWIRPEKAFWEGQPRKMRVSNKKLTRGGLAVWARILFWTFCELACQFLPPKSTSALTFCPPNKKRGRFGRSAVGRQYAQTISITENEK
jgi:hypothetical protein